VARVLTLDLARAVTDALRRDGFSVERETIGGVPAHVARRTFFRWRWVATRLHVYVVAFDRTVSSTAEAAGRVESALEFALSQPRRLPRGVQTGVLSVVVLTAEQVDPELRAWARWRPRPRFAGWSLPIVFDLETGERLVPVGRGVSGIVYDGFLRELAARIVAAAAAL
jgi:hypothetical protein